VGSPWKRKRAPPDEQSTVRARTTFLAPTIWAYAFGTLLLVLGLVGTFAKFGSPLALLLLLPGVALTWYGFRGRSIKVGSDGIKVRGLLKRRFIAYDQISYVKSWSRGTGQYRQSGVALSLLSGEVLEVEVEDVEAVVKRVREEQGDFIDAQDELVADAVPEHRLAQAGREPWLWLHELRELCRPAAYREQRVTTKVLWNVVENASAAAEQRGASAMSLTPLYDRRDRERLRIVAESTSHKPLRIVLETAADDDATDEQRAEALVQVAKTQSQSSPLWGRASP